VYGYKQAYKNSPGLKDISLLHKVLISTWGTLPSVIDPTAGGGSIPYEVIRYGLPAIANDLNPVAASVLRAGVKLPARYGVGLAVDLEKWGKVLIDRIEARLKPAYEKADKTENVIAYIFARTIQCPRTGKDVPLVPDWWLSKGKSPIAVRLVTHRSGNELNQIEFEIVSGSAIDFDPSKGTVSGGDATSPWDGLVIEGDYIKSEAQSGRMGSVLYAASVRKTGKRTFRAPTNDDLRAIKKSRQLLDDLEVKWAQDDILPNEEVPHGNDARPHHYGMGRWRMMFSPRQLLAHGTFVEEFQALVPEVRAGTTDLSRADAVLALIATMQGKALNYNAYLSSWHVTKSVMRSVFERHDFAFIVSLVLGPTFGCL
jgi:adenine-specific DNA methylase